MIQRNYHLIENENFKKVAVNAIIKDGRSFNDSNKPGINRLFNSLLDGLS